MIYKDFCLWRISSNIASASSFSGINFQVYGDVSDFVVILQAVGRGHGMKNQWTIKT